MRRSMPSRVHLFFRVAHPSGGGLTVAVLADVGQAQTFEGGDDLLRRAVATEAAAATRDGHAVYKSLALLGAIGDSRDSFGDVARAAEGLCSPGCEEGPRSARGLLRDSRFLRCLQSVLDSDAETAVVGFLSCESAAADGLVSRQLSAAGRIRIACPVADAGELASIRARTSSQLEPMPAAESCHPSSDRGGAMRRSEWSAADTARCQDSAASPLLGPAPPGPGRPASLPTAHVSSPPRRSGQARAASASSLVREANVLLERAAATMRRAQLELDWPHSGQRWRRALQDALTSIQPATTILTAMLCAEGQSAAADVTASRQTPSRSRASLSPEAAHVARGTGCSDGTTSTRRAESSAGALRRQRCSEGAPSRGSDEASIVVTSTADSSRGPMKRLPHESSSKSPLQPLARPPSAGSPVRDHPLFDTSMSPPTAQALSPVFPPEPWTPDSRSAGNSPELRGSGEPSGAPDASSLGRTGPSGQQRAASQPTPQARRDAPQPHPLQATPEAAGLASPPVASWFAYTPSEHSRRGAQILRAPGTPTTRA